MRRATFFVTSLVALGLAVLASSAAASSAQSTNIDVGNFYFCSAPFENGVCDTTIIAGSTVTWQVAAGTHTVTQCDASFASCPPSGGFDSGLLSSGGNFSQVFTGPGTISYWCTFHPTQMRGRILVQAQPTASPPPSTPGPAVTPISQGATAAPPTARPSAAAQIPASGGTPGDGPPWATAAIGMTLLALSCVAAAGTFAMSRRRVGTEG